MNNAAPVRAESTLIPFAALFIPTRASLGRHPFQRKGAEQTPLRTGYSRLPHGRASGGASHIRKAGLKEPGQMSTVAPPAISAFPHSVQKRMIPYPSLLLSKINDLP